MPKNERTDGLDEKGAREAENKVTCMDKNVRESFREKEK